MAEFNLDEFMQKYKVHPETAAYLQARIDAGARTYDQMGAQEAKQASETGVQTFAGDVQLDGTETELTVPSGDTPSNWHIRHPGATEEIGVNVFRLWEFKENSNVVNGGIPITVYKPTSCEKISSPIILIYYHGGGNVVGSRKSHQTVCKILARDTPCIVVTVEYRLAPEHPFPTNNDDARTVVDWVTANKVAVGGASDSKLGVSGDSAGGRLAAVVCHERRKLVDFAVLVYPNVSMRFEHPSVEEFKTGPLLTWTLLQWFRNHYGITDENMDHPRASVLRSTDFSGLPPTLLIVADLDPLRDGCYEYYKKLKEAGTDVHMTTIKGVPHAFFHLAAAFKENCQEAYSVASKFIQKFSK